MYLPIKTVVITVHDAIANHRSVTLQFNLNRPCAGIVVLPSIQTL